MPGFSFTLVADDLAISPAVSRGILEALAAGRISGTGAMTNRPSWPQAARQIEAAGFAQNVGLHLNLTCGDPLTAMPVLAAGGHLPALKPILNGARRGSLPRQELVNEISAQLDRFTDEMGRLPAYLDGHQHVHALPQIREVLIGEMVRRGWQGRVWLRDSADHLTSILRRRSEPVKALAVKAFVRGFASFAKDAGFDTNSGFSGFSAFRPDRNYALDFERYLVSPGQRHLIMCHPGHVDDELRAVDPHTQSRENELKFLLSDEFPQLLARYNAALRDTPVNINNL